MMICLNLILSLYSQLARGSADANANTSMTGMKKMRKARRVVAVRVLEF